RCQRKFCALERDFVVDGFNTWSYVGPMATDKTLLEAQIFGLPARERARIALKLIESLDPGADEDVDELWLDEAEQRLAAYDAGKEESSDAFEALAEIERQLK